MGPASTDRHATTKTLPASRGSKHQPWPSATVVFFIRLLLLLVFFVFKYYSQEALTTIFIIIVFRG